MGLFINPKRERDYVPVGDRGLPPEQQHHFKLRCLTATQYESRKDLSNEVDAKMPNVQRVLLGTWQLYTLRYGLFGIEGPATAVPFVIDPRSGYVADSFLDTLHPVLRRELALEIERLSTVGADDLLD